MTRHYKQILFHTQLLLCIHSLQAIQQNINTPTITIIPALEFDSTCTNPLNGTIPQSIMVPRNQTIEQFETTIKEYIKNIKEITNNTHTLIIKNEKSTMILNTDAHKNQTFQDLFDPQYKTISLPLCLQQNIRLSTPSYYNGTKGYLLTNAFQDGTLSLDMTVQKFKKALSKLNLSLFDNPQKKPYKLLINTKELQNSWVLKDIFPSNMTISISLVPIEQTPVITQVSHAGTIFDNLWHNRTILEKCALTTSTILLCAGLAWYGKIHWVTHSKQTPHFATATLNTIKKIS
jgi:hypothetical protein